MKTATFSFDQNLAELLPRSWPDSTGSYSFTGPQSVKHLIEALGIPHTEVGAVAVNGVRSEMNFLPQDGDTVEVSAAGTEIGPCEEPRFAIDGHLGRLSAGLRMLGFDCAYRAQVSDEQLADLSVGEARVLLTRDRHLLMRKTVSHGLLIRHLDPPAQLEEVVRRFQLSQWFRPFRRCIRCNHLIEAIEKQAVVDRLEPLTRLYFDEFRMCPACRQIYWKGSHFRRMQPLITRLTALGPDKHPA